METPEQLSVAKKQFEEFVRISFDSDPVDNSLEGSRASDKLSWIASFNAAMQSSIDPLDPYYFPNSKLSPISSLGIGHSIPRSLTQNSGNGVISINPISLQNAHIDPYNLFYQTQEVPNPDDPSNPIKEGRWILYRVISTGDDEIVAFTQFSANGEWGLETPSVKIKIREGSIPFVQTDYTFLLYNMTENIPEQITTNE